MDVQAAAPRRLLLAASTGGHLQELVRHLPTLNASDDSLWVTFRSPQSESLLAGRRVLYVPYVRPRDLRGVARTMRLISGVLRRGRFDGVVSTGAAIALGVLPAARLAGVPATYIESVCRVNGPSTTGRVLELTRAADLRTQHDSWAGGRWSQYPSILSGYETTGRDRPPLAVGKIFVTLGTIRGYRFDSLVDAVLASGLANERTVWQTGFTTRTDLPGRVSDLMTTAEFEREALDSDVVVSHAGVGTLLGLLDLGIHPVMIVRRSARGEHVDDHQAEIAALVNTSKIGTAGEVSDINRRMLERASKLQIVDRQRDLVHQLPRSA